MLKFLQFDDPLPSWQDGFQFPSEDKIFTPAPLGDRSAPNDNLGEHVNAGIKSIGERSLDFFNKTADLFASTLEGVAQGKEAYDTVFRPDAQRPQTPVDHSQLPSLQGTSDSKFQLDNWFRLRDALARIGISNQAEVLSLPPIEKSSTSPLLAAGFIGLLIFLAVRFE